ncbi:MAG: hypothetical protein JW735_10280, partial [Prolixibacteraceae bacterium]|nr:hypothetical protein [Prolixibacteraceae bacterium]
PKMDGDKTGLIIMGEDYAYLACEFIDGKTFITLNACENARTEGKQQQIEKIETNGNSFFFKVNIYNEANYSFAYSTDGTNFIELKNVFKARAGRWIGAKVGIFALKENNTNDSGYTDFDWFIFE